jgi:hypothetical protein
MNQQERKLEIRCLESDSSEIKLKSCISNDKKTPENYQVSFALLRMLELRNLQV